MRPAVLSWYKNFSWETLRSDLIAGITVAPIVIPQSMAYAQLAGVPPYYGLYAALLPPIFASMFGSSHQLSTGPVAMSSLMSAAIISTLAKTGSETFIAYSILLALIVGIFRLIVGLLRMAILINFLSHPVVLGFTNAAAIIIGTSQLSKLFNVFVDNSEHTYQTVINVLIEAIHYIHYPTFFMAVFAMIIIASINKINPKIPGVLIAIIITSIIAWATNFENNKKVDLSTISDTETVTMLNEFNKAANAINMLLEQTVIENDNLHDAEEKYGKYSTETLDIKLLIDEMTLGVNEYRQTTHEYRKKLREIRFSGVTTDGVTHFYRKGNLPPNVKDDGVSWHLKIGNNPVKLNAIPMIGGGEVVGKVPQGIPKLSVPKFNLRVILNVIPGSIVILLLGLMEIVAVVKALSVRTGQRVDLNQELIGQGLANIVGSFSSSCVVSGSFARTAVNLQAGAVTGMSTVFTSGIVAITLMFFTPLLYYMPQSVLASIISLAVFKLMNIKGVIQAWHAQKYDGIIAIATFASTLIFAPHIEGGIIIGIGLTLANFLYRNMKPRIALLSKTPENTFRDAELLNLSRCEYISIIRFDGSLLFANTSYLEDQIIDRLLVKKSLKHILIVGNGINELDATGEDMLNLLVDKVRNMRIEISFIGVKLQVLQVMQRTHLYEKIGEENFYATIDQALTSIYEGLHFEGHEQNCPLLPSNSESIYEKID
ncbi:MAG: STAS domain-containing protein [Nitrospirae bacterium]|nr:STAS domain-containing protein [Nitrospirota bacterium]MBF0541797.1 STAS domain-containing protein [Nitrospirota bacterium]